MKSRLRLLLLLGMAAFGLGASNSSNSSYSIHFPGDDITSEQAVSLAVSVLQEQGYRGRLTGTSADLQLQASPNWAVVRSPTQGVLEVSFTQIRGGCAHIQEVGGSRAAVESVRSAFEARVGSTELRSSHKANSLDEAR